MADRTTIPNFFRGRCLFITGVTGFMGKVLLEKLLRSCPAIHRCYVLIRPKRGQGVGERLENLLESRLFDVVKRDQPDYKAKIVPVAGDILEPRFGLTEEDENTLIENVSVVFHSAATVKFDEELKLSVQMNVIGVQRLLDICHKMKKLEALIHVSTAYANCDKANVDELVYEPPLHPRKLLDAVEWMDAEAINSLTQRLIGSRPNTYTYTKAMAEFLLVEECRDLPTAIVRPSIVGASWKEPVPGWVDNFNGPTGLLAAIGKGLLRTMHGRPSAVADLIPVDIATNMMIAAAWYTAVEGPKQCLVYNCTTGQSNPFTWGEMERMSYKYFMKNPLDMVARIPNPHFTRFQIFKRVSKIFDHILPAYLMDAYFWVIGKRPMFVKIQQRLWKAVSSLEFFTSHQWKFADKNVQMLLTRLSSEDRKNFPFDVHVIDWEVYMENYCLGTKQFVLKEELDKLPRARRALNRLLQISRVFNVLLVLAVWRFLVNRSTVARSLWNLLIGWALWLLQRIPGFARAS